MTLFNPEACNFFKKVVETTVDYREKNNIIRNDFMSLMIKLKNTGSVEDENKNITKPDDSALDNFNINTLAAHCFIFYLAGFESSTSIVKYALYEIARNPDVQEKLREEVNEVVKSNDGEVTYDSLKEMRYLDNIFNETMRKYPVIAMLNRKCTKDFPIPNTNIVIKEGTRCVISTIGLHHDPEFYPDPEKFDPDRFTDEEKAKRPQYAFLPFGGGPRLCTGLLFGTMASKLCIAYLVKKFKFSTNQKLKFCSFGNVLGTEEPVCLSVEKI